MNILQERSFGQRLRYERDSLHSTQQQLAEKIGGSVPSINRWENDRAVPHSDMVKKLCEVFGKPIDQWGRAVHKKIAWNVPFLRNQYFTGREQVLARLHKDLTADNTVALTQTRAISGLGGIGKTQTALEYAYRYAEEYEAVLWVRADSHELLLSEFASLATALDLPEKDQADQSRAVAAVKWWLREQSPWLLVVDNADDIAMVFEFLPSRGGGATLLTTRSQATGQHIKKIELGKMSREEGISFLFHRAGLLEEEPFSGEISEQEQQAAEQIYQLMDGLPLALDQAAAYMEETRCGLKDYLSLYQIRRSALLQRRGGLSHRVYPASVAATWSLSFHRIEERNPAATELLQLCAYLAPDAIAEEILTAGASSLGLVLAPVAADAFGLNEAIEALRSYSLVQRDPGEKTLSVHRLVQTVLQDVKEETGQRLWAERAMLAVNAAFPKVEHDTWPQCERLLPHALTVAQGIERYQIRSPEAGHLLHEAASYLQVRARYAEAESLYQRALYIREQRLGSEHSDVATTLNGLAELYWEMGKYIDAESLYQHALRIREQQLGSEHSDVATTLNGLALIYWKLGKYAEAEPLYQRALRIWEQQLGSEHSDVALLLNNLAYLHRDQGKYAEAEPLFQRALSIWEQQLGSEHPDIGYSLNGLAQLYWELGKYAEAESLYQRALHIREQWLVPEHPDIATSLNNLALIYWKLDKYAEAEPLFQRALSIRKRQLGPEHPDTALSLNGLALLYCDQGKHVEAELLFQRALSIWEQQLGPEHLYVALPLNNLALIYWKLGKYAEAEPLYQRALHIREQRLVPEHPDIATSLNNLALLYRDQERYLEAEPLFQRALHIREQVLGSLHPETKETHKYLIALLHALEEHKQAAKLGDHSRTEANS